MLERQLEPEVMDTAEDAAEYDSMDHDPVNRIFVTDFLVFASANGRLAGDILDVGTGTAQIPIELCRADHDASVVAVDLSEQMLLLAQRNVDHADLHGRVRLTLGNSRRLDMPVASVSAVISNSIIHHIPEPILAIREMVRVVRPGGLIFVRDLLRPESEYDLLRLVDLHAVGATEYQRRLFADSLHAALTVAEMRELVGTLGFAPADVQQTSDRHWTWASVQPA